MQWLSSNKISRGVSITPCPWVVYVENYYPQSTCGVPHFRPISGESAGFGAFLVRGPVAILGDFGGLPGHQSTRRGDRALPQGTTFVCYLMVHQRASEMWTA